jgi:hypothetical protein
VQASTVYEAVCRASAIFRHAVVEDPTWTAEFLVEVLAQKSYRIKPETLRHWLARSGTSPKEHTQRKRLKQMLEGN